MSAGKEKARGGPSGPPEQKPGSGQRIASAAAPVPVRPVSRPDDGRTERRKEDLPPTKDFLSAARRGAKTGSRNPFMPFGTDVLTSSPLNSIVDKAENQADMSRTKLKQIVVKATESSTFGTWEAEMKEVASLKKTELPALWRVRVSCYVAPVQAEAERWKSRLRSAASVWFKACVVKSIIPVDGNHTILTLTHPAIFAARTTWKEATLLESSPMAGDVAHITYRWTEKRDDPVAAANDLWRLLDAVPIASVVDEIGVVAVFQGRHKNVSGEERGITLRWEGRGEKMVATARAVSEGACYECGCLGHRKLTCAAFWSTKRGANTIEPIPTKSMVKMPSHESTVKPLSQEKEISKEEARPNPDPSTMASGVEGDLTQTGTTLANEASTGENFQTPGKVKAPPEVLPKIQVKEETRLEHVAFDSNVPSPVKEEPPGVDDDDVVIYKMLNRAEAEEAKKSRKSTRCLLSDIRAAWSTEDVEELALSRVTETWPIEASMKECMDVWKSEKLKEEVVAERHQYLLHETKADGSCGPHALIGALKIMKNRDEEGKEWTVEKLRRLVRDEHIRMSEGRPHPMAEGKPSKTRRDVYCSNWQNEWWTGEELAMAARIIGVNIMVIGGKPLTYVDVSNTDWNDDMRPCEIFIYGGARHKEEHWRWATKTEKVHTYRSGSKETLAKAWEANDVDIEKVMSRTVIGDDDVEAMRYWNQATRPRQEKGSESQ